MQSFVADVDVCSNSLMVYAMLMERKMDLLFLKSYATIAEKRGIVSTMRLGSFRITSTQNETVEMYMYILVGSV